MTRWLTMLLANGTYEGRQIVDPKALLPAITPQIVSDRATEPAMRSGLLRLRIQRGHDVGRPHATQPLRRIRVGLGHQLPHAAVSRRGDRRADQCHPVRRPGDAHRPVRRPRAVRRDAARTGQALPRRLRADGGAGGHRWSASSPRPNPLRRSRFRPTSAATRTTSGGRRGSPSRRQARPGAGARNWLFR